MISKRDVKIPGGKLLRVEVEAEAGVVLRAVVRGDFFAHPEEAFEEAEASLSGLALAGLPAAAALAFSRPGLVIFGAGPPDIAEALRRAIDEHQAP